MARGAGGGRRSAAVSPGQASDGAAAAARHHAGAASTAWRGATSLLLPLGRQDRAIVAAYCGTDIPGLTTLLSDDNVARDANASRCAAWVGRQVPDDPFDCRQWQAEFPGDCAELDPGSACRMNGAHLPRGKPGIGSPLVNSTAGNCIALRVGFR
jgi:hypothetical protein